RPALKKSGLPRHPARASMATNRFVPAMVPRSPAGRHSASHHAMDDQEPPQTSLKSRGPLIAVLLVALVLGVAAFVTWRVLYAPQVQVPDAGTPEVVDAGPEPIQGADITEGESVAREAMGGLVPESWLKDGD